MLYTAHMKRELELYLHIPFCVKKCLYCDFLSAPASKEIQREYVQALKQEIWENRKLGQDYEVISIFFGGGTPSILEGEQIGGLLEELKKYFSMRSDAEITVECNPGTLTAEKLDWYQRAGVNRLSLGLQSAQNTELKALGRIHTWEMFLESYRLVRKAGFTNVNIDLMSALPGQTRESWKDTLEKATGLNPEHISAYSLIIEEGTPFYEWYGQGSSKEIENLSPLPDEDTERQMYYDTREILRKKGYAPYEISNYAKPGLECRHNMGYWRRTEYKGFGVGASSLLDGCRMKNSQELKLYLNRQFIIAEQEILTPADVLSETMFLGLRTMEGVYLTEQMRHIYKEALKKHCAQGLLCEEDGFLRLTERGIDVSNWVLADFLLDKEEVVGMEEKEK